MAGLWIISMGTQIVVSYKRTLCVIHESIQFWNCKNIDWCASDENLGMSISYKLTVFFKQLLHAWFTQTVETKK